MDNESQERRKKRVDWDEFRPLIQAMTSTLKQIETVDDLDNAVLKLKTNIRTALYKSTTEVVFPHNNRYGDLPVERKLARDWPFGNWYCTVSNFIANATVAASVFTLTGISCDRYLAIVYPLHPRMSKTASLITITLIWSASMMIALPCLLYSTTITNIYKGVQRTGCIIVWPDNKIIGSTYDLWYQMLFLFITYIVPMLLMSMCYTVMGRVLWGSRSIGEKTQRQIDSIRSKRKVVKMFISVVMIFGICWLPYHSYFIYIYFDTTVIFSKYTQHVYLGFYWFAMSNAMVNPLIYYWMNARFRQYFKSAICGWKSCISDRVNIEDSPQNADRHSQSFSKSGDGATVRIRISSNREKDHRYQNGNALQHYSQLLANNNSNFENGSPHNIRRSRKWSHRSVSARNKHVTTDL